MLLSEHACFSLCCASSNVRTLRIVFGARLVETRASLIPDFRGPLRSQANCPGHFSPHSLPPGGLRPSRLRSMRAAENLRHLPVRRSTSWLSASRGQSRSSVILAFPCSRSSPGVARATRGTGLLSAHTPIPRPMDGLLLVHSVEHQALRRGIHRIRL
jgi:hypothetical protein